MAEQIKRDDGHTQCSECKAFDKKHYDPCSQLRPFPIQGGGDIPWWLAEEAYKHYAELFPGSARQQSLAHLAERGGFGVQELLHYLRKEKI